MKLKNVLIVVKDIEKSKKFYHDLFGLETVLDNDGNMILTEGLVLQEEKSGRTFWGRVRSRRITQVNSILRSPISKRLLIGLRDTILRFSM